MVAPIIQFTNDCCQKLPKENRTKQEWGLRNKIMCAAGTVDALLAISSLVIGILATFSIIAMPAAVTYSLLGLSGGIFALWMTAFIKQDTCPDKQLPCFVTKRPVRRRLLFS